MTLQCAIAGGGPAGMMLGFVLARAGVDVLVLEKHGDFLRDFRGDTIHPSTLQLMHELGLLDEFLKLPHERVHALKAQIGDEMVRMADFDRLPTRCKFIAFMPQWDFLDFLADQGARYASFKLAMRAEVTGLIEEGGRVTGVRVTTQAGPAEHRADLVVAADGRHSTVRAAAGLPVQEFGAPMDVLWFRISRRRDDPGDSMGRFEAGQIFVLIARGEHWQCGYVIPKGTIDRLQREGLPAFRERIAKLVPFLRDRTGEIRQWDDVKLLTVQVDRLRRWSRPGLLCIGDAAHAMSPVAGVGINLAIQDAVAAANILAVPLRERRVTPEHLQQVQRRREWPTRVTQRLQLTVQNRVISRVLATGRSLSPPPALRLVSRIALFRGLAGRLIGMGVRPEHIRTPSVPPSTPPSGGAGQNPSI